MRGLIHRAVGDIGVELGSGPKDDSATVLEARILNCSFPLAPEQSSKLFSWNPSGSRPLPTSYARDTASAPKLISSVVPGHGELSPGFALLYPTLSSHGNLPPPCLRRHHSHPATHDEPVRAAVSRSRASLSLYVASSQLLHRSRRQSVCNVQVPILRPKLAESARSIMRLRPLPSSLQIAFGFRIDAAVQSLRAPGR